MKYYLLFSLLLLADFAEAFVVWPNASAPCNTTLQACVDGSPEGEFIEIRTDAVIDESIFTNKLVSLAAGDGYNPVFAAGRNINIISNTATSRTLIVRGLTLTEGTMVLNHFGASGTFIVENNRFLDHFTDAANLLISSSSNGDLEVRVNYNHLYNDIDVPPAAPMALLMIRKSLGLGTVSGQVYGNTVTAEGSGARAISIYNASDVGTIDINVTGNEIYGGEIASLLVWNDETGNMDVDISSNAFYKAGPYFSSGIQVLSESGGSLETDIINNTVIQATSGIVLEVDSGTGATLDASVHNNLLAYNATGFSFDALAVTTNNHNLSYQNSNHVNYTPGSNALNVDPKIIGFHNARLQPDSPADGAGNSIVLFAVGDAPLVDADGLARLKAGSNGNVVDIGAYERGDTHFYHRHSRSDTHIAQLDHPATNNQTTLNDLHVTSNYNPNLTGGVINNAHEGVFYSLADNKWSIFNQAFELLNFSAAFNVSRIASQGNTFEHTNNDSGANNTVVNNSGMNGNGDLFVLVTQHWTGTYNPHPIGLQYFASRWAIMNLDLQNMPILSNFNVYYQSLSKSAWKHRATDRNTTAHITYLDNPIINGVPCAQIQITQNATGGVFNAAPVGVGYSSSQERWYIFNQDLSDIPENANFFVLANPEQVAECSDLIFEDDFD